MKSFIIIDVKNYSSEEMSSFQNNLYDIGYRWTFNKNKSRPIMHIKDDYIVLLDDMRIFNVGIEIVDTIIKGIDSNDVKRFQSISEFERSYKFNKLMEKMKNK